MNKYLHPLQNVGWNFLSILKLQRMNLPTDSQTSMVTLLKFESDKNFLPILYWACDYLPMLGLKLIHVSERGLCCHLAIDRQPRQITRNATYTVVYFASMYWAVLLLWNNCQIPTADII